MNIKRARQTALYSIMTDEVARAKVYDFAETHKMQNSQIHESFDGEVYLIDFYISKPVDAVNAYIKEKLGVEFKVKIGENYIYVFEKEES